MSRDQHRPQNKVWTGSSCFLFSPCDEAISSTTFPLSAQRSLNLRCGSELFSDIRFQASTKCSAKRFGRVPVWPSPARKRPKYRYVHYIRPLTGAQKMLQWACNGLNGTERGDIYGVKGLLELHWIPGDGHRFITETPS